MMSSAALRLEIEHALECRFPAALTPAPRAPCEKAATGIPEVDGLLEGGLPVGAISEVTGPECSGRTSLALAFVALRTQEGRACAWVDADDAFDPESAAANGVGLRRLLWVRCGSANMPAKSMSPMPNQTWSPAKLATKPWTKLDQALRAADLLLQAGGFAAIVLDLGETAPEHGNRIPLATWFRFRQAAARTRCSLLVLGQAAFAQSSAAAVLECSPLRTQAKRGTVLNGFTFAVRSRRRTPAQAMAGAHESGSAATDFSRWGGKPGSAATDFSRWGGKPPASTWQSVCAWDTEKRA